MAWRGNARVFDDHEAFIQLYYQLSKGGCKDFTEETRYIIGDEETMLDDRYTERYSYLTFKNITILGNERNRI